MDKNEAPAVMFLVQCPAHHESSLTVRRNYKDVIISQSGLSGAKAPEHLLNKFRMSWPPIVPFSDMVVSLLRDRQFHYFPECGWNHSGFGWHPVKHVLLEWLCILICVGKIWLAHQIHNSQVKDNKGNPFLICVM